jgi:hypothetical protein
MNQLLADNAGRPVPAWRRVLAAGWTTPAGMLVRAGGIAAAFVLCHAAGLRDYIGILCGTSATSAPPTGGMALLAAVYLVADLALVIVAPVLLIAAALLGTADRIAKRGKRREA